MNFANQIKNIIDEQITRYSSNNGKGADAYCPQDLYHPMADGKYLQSLAALYEGGLLSKEMFAKKSAQALYRLHENSLEYFKDTLLWGLGFSYKGLPETEPFLITSSIILAGMHTYYEITRDDTFFEKVIKAAYSGIFEWVKTLSDKKDEKSLPLYAPNTPIVIYNASAHALSTLISMSHRFPLQDSAPEWCGNLNKKMEYIFSLRIQGLGWAYAADNPIVDLIHQCYILNSMRNIVNRDVLEAATIEMIGQFRCQEGFLDGIKIIDKKTWTDDIKQPLWIRTLPDCQILVSPKNARLWSLGELLVLLSYLAQTGESKPSRWLQEGHWVAKIIMSRLTTTTEAESRYPRHIMHAIHGLASYLAVLRQRNGNRV